MHRIHFYPPLHAIGLSIDGNWVWFNPLFSPEIQILEISQILVAALCRWHCAGAVPSIHTSQM